MDRVVIRPLQARDAFISWHWRNDPKIWKYTGNKPDKYITADIEKQWIEKILLDTTSHRFAITVDHEYVGNIQLTNIIERKSAEYHIFIGNKNYWGKGVAQLATRQILNYAKEVLKLNTVYLYVNAKNKAALKVYEKMGFKYSSSDSNEIYMENYL